VALVLAAGAVVALIPSSGGALAAWQNETIGTGKKLTCFVRAQPGESKPDGVRRGPIGFMVSNRPADDVWDEVSVAMGYPLKAESTPTITVGGESFDMFVRNENAWIADEQAEDRFIAAAKAGSSMTVEGISTRGTKTTDSYSLIGITAALERSRKACAEESPQSGS
jgi:hypothetical protein